MSWILSWRGGESLRIAELRLGAVSELCILCFMSGLWVADRYSTDLGRSTAQSPWPTSKMRLQAVRPLGLDPESLTWRFTGSYKWGYK